MTIKAAISDHGYVFIPGNECKLLDAKTRSVTPQNLIHHIVSALDGWFWHDFTTIDDAIESALTAYNEHRITLNIEACLHDISDSLIIEFGNDTESQLSLIAGTDRVMSRLLRAPLRDKDTLRSLASAFLGSGNSATAAFVDELRELQPLIQRLCDRWLQLSPEIFADLSGGRQEAWVKASLQGTLYRACKAASSQEMTSAWTTLAFAQPPKQHAIYLKVASALTSACFPQDRKADDGPLFDDYDLAESSTQIPGSATSRDNRLPHEIYRSVRRQIDSIAQCVASGKDQLAHKFLRELIEGQVKQSSNERFAVKSLCNIATMCADMFRHDFEHECLMLALELQPADSWVLVQYANHLKSCGRYAEAISKLQEAKSAGNDTVAESSLASIYVDMGRYGEAIEKYKSIPSHNDDIAIRNAIADAYRKAGRFDEAVSLYLKLQRDGNWSHRISAGLAEIDKYSGDLDSAESRYLSLLKHYARHLESDDIRALAIYQMGLSNVYMRKSDYVSAYRILDDVVGRVPFMHQARLLRAAAIAMKGDPAAALASLPQLGQGESFGRWMHDHVRGLLLLLLDRFEDAAALIRSTILNERVSQSKLPYAKMLAAVELLPLENGALKAREILGNLPGVHDRLAQKLVQTLEYHVATKLSLEVDLDRLQSELEKDDSDRDLVAAAQAIRAGNWAEARRWEAACLLRIIAAA